MTATSGAPSTALGPPRKRGARRSPRPPGAAKGAPRAAQKAPVARIDDPEVDLWAAIREARERARRATAPGEGCTCDRCTTPAPYPNPRLSTEALPLRQRLIALGVIHPKETT